MTLPGIWTQNAEGWKLSRPEGFPDEATLHGLIEETPEMLPLSGARVQPEAWKELNDDT